MRVLGGEQRYVDGRGCRGIWVARVEVDWVLAPSTHRPSHPLCSAARLAPHSARPRRITLHFGDPARAPLRVGPVWGTSVHDSETRRNYTESQSRPGFEPAPSILRSAQP
jgi:hypothetical protein